MCTFETTSSLKCLVEHCQNVHKWKPRPCDEDNCNYVAFSQQSYSSHKTRFHFKLRSFAPKAFPCTWEKCKSSFKCHHDLLKHLKVHNNDLLDCVFCPFRTDREFEMRAHYRLHFKILDFKCEICDKTFCSKGRLNHHYSLRHETEVFTCHICKSYTGIKNLLQAHIKHRHNCFTKWNDATKTFDTFSRE